ncbi:MAG: hypothetical protein NTX03_00535 [Bacteroidetes bacterium]|nr:hypothetical protein [Bacteroidota bacterium]
MIKNAKKFYWFPQIFSVIILSFIAANSFAQTYGNEWIVQGQKYYKVKVFKNGLYKLDGTVLSGLGSPADAEIWWRGKQIPIQVSVAGSSFNSGDFILFYGERNNGDLDSALYYKTSNQPHRDYSMYSDTAVYFLTFNSSGSKQRITTTQQYKSTSYTAQKEFTQEAAKYFNNAYSPGICIAQNILMGKAMLVILFQLEVQLIFLELQK